MELLRDNGANRVVITGVGVLSALGTAAEMWSSLKQGKSGIRHLESLSIENLPVKIGGEVRDFDPLDFLDKKDARRMGRATQFALAATEMALADAGLTASEIEMDQENIGVVVGTSLGSHELAIESALNYRTGKTQRPNPLGLINSLPNMPAHHVGKFYRFMGPSRTLSATCASGTQSIGEASDLIRTGRCRFVVAGGVESIIQDYALAAFHATGVLATGFDHEPESASRPFDARRTGFVYSEGTAMVVVESLQSARERNANIYAEIVGYGTASDAYHIVAPDPTGRGPELAMKWALKDARIDAESIHYINAHGTSTPLNDRTETLAIKNVFGDNAYRIPISSSKSMLGHALAGSGAIEIVACCFSLSDDTIHPTINYDSADPDCDLDYVPNESREITGLEYVLSNSLGIGGQNASVILRKL